MERRRFIKLCGTTAALAGLQLRYLDMVRAGEAKSFNRVKLVDGQGNALKAKNLSTKEAYISNYPFKSTPCVLINLPAKAGGRRLRRLRPPAHHPQETGPPNPLLRPGHAKQEGGRPHRNHRLLRT